MKEGGRWGRGIRASLRGWGVWFVRRRVRGEGWARGLVSGVVKEMVRLLDGGGGREVGRLSLGGVMGRDLEG